MDKGERQALAERIAWLRRRGDQARRVAGARLAVVAQGREARAHLQGRLIPCVVDGRQHHVLAFSETSDAGPLRQLLAAHRLPVLDSAGQAALSIDSDDVRASLKRAEGLTKARRALMSPRRRRELEVDARHVLAMHERATDEGLEARLEALRPVSPDGALPVEVLARELVGPDAAIIPGGRVRAAWAGREALQEARQIKASAEQQIHQLGAEIRSGDVDRTLSEMPVQALKQSTSGRLRLGAIEAAGLKSVHAVLEFGPHLSVIDGVGEQTARQVWAAAETLRSMLHRETPIRIDVKHRDRSAERLLTLLWRWAKATDVVSRADGSAEALSGLDPLLMHGAFFTGDHVTHLVTTSGASAQKVADALDAVGTWEADCASLNQPPGDPWLDFLMHPADYLGWLSHLGFLTEDDGAAEGQLSADLIARVRAQDLDTSGLRGVSLRGYQDFGARFALAQRKVVIGDEMGLGKTIEALAVLAHVHAKDGTHSVVVCPAAVLSNWSREIRGRSDLEVHVLHGLDRTPRAERWSRRGGVAVTTFATLRSVLVHVTSQEELHAVVVDEAHYIKNPIAKRTIDSRLLIDRAHRAVLLTGTPIENRLQEFSNLVSYLQPELVDRLDEYTPGSFPRLIAPAYLRRNQEDVLTELPERIDVEEWIPMSASDEALYVAAVAEGNFMAMRRAALMGGHGSAKLERLVELVQEARANHRKVIVFSYFRDVLDEVMTLLEGDLFGPLTGSVAARDRQRIIDAYSAAPAGAVLVSQITAGGVGLNIQAGSVVVICEPQVKPSMETQAIARAHRMGQTQTVQVHRLLSDEGVDRRMVEILNEKQRLFDEFARVSHTADSAPEAHDITEGEMARQVITEERERLARRNQNMNESSNPAEETA